MRIVSLCPSNTELLVYIGACEHLVGVDNYSDWPEGVRQLPRVGPDLSIDMHHVERLQPDLVLASLSVPGMERNVRELEQRGIPHLVLNPHSFAEIGEDLLRVGTATGRETEANQAAAAYHAFLRMYRETAAALASKPRLYWEWWPKPVFTPGRANWLTEMSRLAGAENIFADCPEASVQTDWDEVRRRNPDHICLAWVGVRQDKVQPAVLKKRQNWLELPALQSGRVHILEEALYCRPSPRLLLGLQQLAYLLHPGVFPPPTGEDPLLSLLRA
ncbi:cobalamin-binding protein [Ectobacillus ponti]|uniref:Cobalamin-binding protein n=1 Tax=Ectobacillus ponti TaxID=2961894 RepID=A0AA41X8L4_9BACI|nr:cobalamin-binding protein [Ectobacillus ponti]MCP8970787.1 cobalamin-binding protein [Ectobacillus ponti]